AKLLASSCNCCWSAVRLKSIPGSRGRDLAHSESSTGEMTPQTLTSIRPYAGMQALGRSADEEEPMASTNGQDNVPSMMSRLIERRTPGRGLEAAFYTSSDIFDFDMEAIFARHWIHVGVEADVPAAGDFVTIDLGRYSIILVRGHDL